MSTPTDRTGQPAGPEGPGSPARLETTIRTEGGETVLAVGGEVDIVSVESFREALLAAQRAPRVVIDLSDVTFIDSSGINALVGAWHGVAPGSTLRLVGLRPNVRKVFEITGLLELFGVDRPDS